MCIVYGTCDTQAISRVLDSNAHPTAEPLLDSASFAPPVALRPGPPFDCRRLYDDIQGTEKLMISIDKTGHYMLWETQSEVLHDYSTQWLKNKKIDDGAGHAVSTGSYHRESSGALGSPT